MTTSSIANNAELDTTTTVSTTQSKDCPDSVARLMFVITIVVCSAFIAGIIAHLF